MAWITTRIAIKVGKVGTGTFLTYVRTIFVHVYLYPPACNTIIWFNYSLASSAPLDPDPELKFHRNRFWIIICEGIAALQSISVV